MDTVLETLTIRELEARDLKILLDLFEQETNEIPVTWPSTKERFLDWINEGILDEFPTKYIIENKENIAGIISIQFITNKNQMLFPMTNIGDADITYLTFKNYSGLGVATFAVDEISRLLIKNHLNPIMRIESSNKASARIAIKSGFIKIDDEPEIQDDFDDVPTRLDIFRKIVV